MQHTGASRRQILYWTQSGILRPLNPGVPRIRFQFDRCALIRIIVIRRLLACGLSLQHIRRTTKSLRVTAIADSIDRDERPVLFCPVDGSPASVYLETGQLIERASVHRGASVLIPFTASMRLLIREQLMLDVPRETYSEGCRHESSAMPALP